MNNGKLIKHDGRMWICCPDCEEKQTYLVYGQVLNGQTFRCKKCGTMFYVNNCLCGKEQINGKRTDMRELQISSARRDR